MTTKWGTLKEQIRLTNVKYLWLSPNTSWAVVFCIDIHMYAISKVICINKEKEMCAKQGID